MNRKLFVANVSWNVGEDDLYNLFAAQGPIDSMKMPVNRITGRHKGYAFIEMVNEEEAVKAVNELNGMTLDNRPLAVNFQDEHRVKRHEMSLYAAAPNPKLFVRNISPTATEEHIFELFSQVGKVVSVKIPVDHFNGEQRTYGFAEMSNTQDAQTVVERFNGTMLEGDDLQILFADPNRINANKNKFPQQHPHGGGHDYHHGAPPQHGGGGYYYPPPPYYAPYPPQHYPGHGPAHAPSHGGHGYPPPHQPHYPPQQDGGNYPPPHHPQQQQGPNTGGQNTRPRGDSNGGPQQQPPQSYNQHHYTHSGGAYSNRYDNDKY